MVGQPELRTERLVLRPLVMADAEVIQRLASDRAVSDCMVSIPFPYPEGEAERYIARRRQAFAAGLGVAFAIALLPSPDLVGVLEIRDIEPEHAQGEVSFWLSPALQGQGYMSEAIAPLLAFAFQTLGLNRLQAYHMVRNPASGKVLQKNGFRPEGVLRQRVCKGGIFEDVVVLAQLRQDWIMGKRTSGS